MKGFLTFIGGFVAGILVTILILFIIGMRNSTGQTSYGMQVQYIEVKGKKGNARLYTGMPKDSVRLLIGKPDEVDLRSFQGTALEGWGYKLKNKYISDLDIDFVDGRLNAVRQN